jgi:hypothetical protein
MMPSEDRRENAQRQHQSQRSIAEDCEHSMGSCNAEFCLHGSKSVATSDTTLPCNAKEKDLSYSEEGNKDFNVDDRLFESMGSEEFRRQFRQRKQMIQQELQQRKGSGKRGSNDGFDCRICTVALCVCVIIIGAVVGVVVGLFLAPLQHSIERSPTTPESPSPPEATSTAAEAVAPTSPPVPPPTSMEATNGSPSPTTFPETAAPIPIPTESPTRISIDCTLSSEHSFPEATTVSLYLLVNDNITDTDLNYAATTFQRSYHSLASSSDTCDSYCRRVTSLIIVSSIVLSTPPDSISDTSVDRIFESGGTDDEESSCLQPLKVVFAVEGTYWGCMDDDTNNFPGLFDSPSNAGSISNNDHENHNNNIFRKSSNNNNNSGRRLRRNTSAKRTQPLPPDDTIMMTRRQQGLEPNGECLPCSQETNPTIASRSHGNGPTPDQLLSAMEPYVTVSPGICGILSIRN